jgi:hypothetical protein
MSIIPDTLEVEIRRTTVQSQPEKKVSKTPISINKLNVVAVPVVPAMWEVVGRSITVWVRSR